MFTGIIEDVGKIASVQSAGQGKRFVIDVSFKLDSVRIGDSIAVNGSCLTAVSLQGGRFEADVSPETLSVSAMSNLRSGDAVNIERAMKLSDRLDGHLVSGHVDGIATLKSITNKSNAIILTFDVSQDLSRYMIKKGSVAVDGISLTINECKDDFFTVSIIPHTAKITTLNLKKVGDKVNIETDLIGKYVEKFFIGKKPDAIKDGKKTSVDMAFLEKTGFL